MLEMRQDLPLDETFALEVGFPWTLHFRSHPGCSSGDIVLRLRPGVTDRVLGCDEIIEPVAKAVIAAHRTYKKEDSD
jgi:hypothetical protein